MQARQKQLLESYERVRDFMRGHVPAKPSAVFVAKVAELEAFVSRLHTLLSDQVTGRKESRDDTARTQLARRYLRERHLKPISKIAKAALGLDPTALKTLALPSFRLTNTRLLTEATGVQAAAVKYEQGADAFEGNAEILTRWRSAKRVQATRGGPRGTGGTADENLPTAA